MIRGHGFVLAAAVTVRRSQWRPAAVATARRETMRGIQVDDWELEPETRTGPGTVTARVRARHRSNWPLPVPRPGLKLQCPGAVERNHVLRLTKVRERRMM